MPRNLFAVDQLQFPRDERRLHSRAVVDVISRRSFQIVEIPAAIDLRRRAFERHFIAGGCLHGAFRHVF